MMLSEYERYQLRLAADFHRGLELKARGRLPYVQPKAKRDNRKKIAMHGAIANVLERVLETPRARVKEQERV